MNKFTCARCKKTYLNNTPEYFKQVERNFGKIPSDPVSICDDCYRWFMDEYAKLTPEEKEEMERDAKHR